MRIFFTFEKKCFYCRGDGNNTGKCNAGSLKLLDRDKRSRIHRRSWIFDSVVISMIIAVFLSEIIGETREKYKEVLLKSILNLGRVWLAA